MKTESDLALLILSIAVYGFVMGAAAALEMLAYSRAEKNGDEDENENRFADAFLQDPVANYFALSAGRLVALLLVIVTANGFAVRHLFAGHTDSAAHIAFVLGAVFLPLLLAQVIALRHPERFIRSARFVTVPVVYLLKPPAMLVVAPMRRWVPWLLNALSAPVLPLQRRIELFGYKNGDEDTDEQSLVSSVLEFGDTKVREIMVPRIDMIAVNIHLNSEEAVGTIMDAGHSRVPVFDESIDKIVGVVHTKDLLKRVVEGGEFSIRAISREPYFVWSRRVARWVTQRRRTCAIWSSS